MKDVLLGSTSKLPEFFQPEIYRPVIEAFCEKRLYPGISRQGLYQRAIMFLSLQLALSNE
jgi:asparagine synthase (glutamine-hydrolysing)